VPSGYNRAEPTCPDAALGKACVADCLRKSRYRIANRTNARMKRVQSPIEKRFVIASSPMPESHLLSRLIDPVRPDDRDSQRALQLHSMKFQRVLEWQQSVPERLRCTWWSAARFPSASGPLSWLRLLRWALRQRREDSQSGPMHSNALAEIAWVRTLLFYPRPSYQHGYLLARRSAKHHALIIVGSVRSFHNTNGFRENLDIDRNPRKTTP